MQLHNYEERSLTDLSPCKLKGISAMEDLMLQPHKPAKGKGFVDLSANEDAQ